MNKKAEENFSTDHLVDVDQKARKSWQSWLAGSPVLLLSILFHLLFVFIAGLLIVERWTEKPKINFSEVPVSSSSSAAAQAAQRKSEVSASKNNLSFPDPQINKSIVVEGASGVSLPEVSLPNESAAPSASEKMTGTSVSGQGLGLGAGISESTAPSEAMDMNTEAIDVATIADSMFGLKSGRGANIEGTFYDMKQTADHKPTGVAHDLYYGVLSDFVLDGWKEAELAKYFKAPEKVYLAQLFIPFMTSDHAPQAFGVQKEVQPAWWTVIYSGQFQVKEEGDYRFVGAADNVLVVRVNNKLLLNAGISRLRKVSPPSSIIYHYPGVSSRDYDFQCGDWIHLTPDQNNQMQILIGDDGGCCGFWLLVEQKNKVYKKNAQGSPILPPFKLTIPGHDLPLPTRGVPAFSDDKLGWTSKADQPAGDQN